MPRTAVPASPEPLMPTEVDLDKVSEHNKTMRFDSADENAPVRAIYIRREVLAQLGDPERIHLSIARGPAA